MHQRINFHQVQVGCARQGRRHVVHEVNHFFCVVRVQRLLCNAVRQDHERWGAVLRDGYRVAAFDDIGNTAKVVLNPRGCHGLYLHGVSSVRFLAILANLSKIRSYRY